MFYSNEVYLINSSYARIVSESKLEDIDIEATLVDYGSRVVFDIVEGTRHRVFKIIDKSSEFKMYSPCILIEREASSYEDGVRLLCRLSDILFMDTRLHTIKGRGEYRHHYLIDGQNLYKNTLIDRFDAMSSIENVCRDVDKMSYLWDRISNGTLVDKSDSRINTHSNRFFLRGSMRTFLGYVEEQDRDLSRVGFNICNYCDEISTKARKKDLSDGTTVAICPNCYTSVEIPCDCCLSTAIISDIINTREINNNANDDIFLENDMYAVCRSCYDHSVQSCSRCRCMDIVNIEKLRNTANKILYLANYIENSKFTRIFSSTYCSNCADMVLNSYLTNPFRHTPLPRKFTNKSEFSRFVGIESEVITDTSGCGEYSEDREVPLHFNVVDDGSLNEGGVEFVTTRPIIGHQVNEALDSLQDVNESEWNTVDSSCGLHIHMNALDMGFTEIKALLMIMSRIQYKLYESIPENRRDTSYAREISISPLEISRMGTLQELVSSYYGMAESNINDEKYNEARYIGTNIHARFYLGSIEFRYHEGVIASNPIREWILFLNKIMTASKNLSNRPRLYNKLINSKFQPIDIIRDIVGVSSTEYIENKIEDNN